VVAASGKVKGPRRPLVPSSNAKLMLPWRPMTPEAPPHSRSLGDECLYTPMGESSGPRVNTRQFKRSILCQNQVFVAWSHRGRRGGGTIWVSEGRCRWVFCISRLMWYWAVRDGHRWIGRRTLCGQGSNIPAQSRFSSRTKHRSR